MGWKVTTGRPAANASIAVSPPAFSTSTSAAAMSHGISEGHPIPGPRPSPVERGLELPGAPANGDGMDPARGGDGLDRRDDRPDPPRPGDHERRPGVGTETQRAPRGAPGGPLGAETLAHERPRSDGFGAGACSRHLGRMGADG